MPSASAKLEKQASTEALDPLKQILTMMEKKVRNLEKRKAKLDTYKSDFSSGKELNEDQKIAITKYDQVVEILEFAKELQKSFSTIVQDNLKLQKKAAKREHVERQQQEISRLKEILLMQDVLNCMGPENVRSDFLNGTNGAMQMSEEDLNQLDELYKLMSVDHETEEENCVPLDEQLSSAAEHLSSLLESKNKEVVGTTYKHLKDIIFKIHACGYFNNSASQEDATKDDELNADENAKGDARKSGEGEEYAEEEEEYDVTSGVTDLVQSNEGQQEEETLVMQPNAGDRSQVERPYFSVSSATSDAPPYSNQNHSLQEVLPMQGSFNFLQESQIDIESPHMDPAVVVAHPIVPPPSLGYPGSQFPSTSQSAPTLTLTVQQHARQAASADEGNLGGHVTPTGVPSAGTPTPVQQQQPPSGAMSAGTAVPLAQNQVNPPPDFDPSRPIPTQTFTNQNFAAAIHPMMVPPSYVPVTISHGNIPPQHMIAVGMVPPTVSPRGTPTPPPVSSSTGSLPMPITSQGAQNATGQGVNLASQQETKDPFGNSEFQIHQTSLDAGASHPAQTSVSQSALGASSSQFQQMDDVQSATGSFTTQSQGTSFGQVRTGYGGNNSNRGNRARGSPNGFSRGSGRSNYGNGRTTRGGTSGRGGTTRGGRGSYRTQ